MSEIKLSSLFELETVEAGIYRGQSWDLGFRALFGGQVLGQALRQYHQTEWRTHFIPTSYCQAMLKNRLFTMLK